MLHIGLNTNKLYNNDHNPIKKIHVPCMTKIYDESKFEELLSVIKQTLQLYSARLGRIVYHLSEK